LAQTGGHSRETKVKPLALLSLFSLAFLSATLLPGSSEVALVGLLAAGKVAAGPAIIVATVGNTLGSITNWALGRFAIHFQDRKWFPASPERLKQATDWYQRFGVWTLLLSWVPIIGDPLTAVAGVLRTPLIVFIPIVAVAKLIRYIVVVWVADAFI
jgi:membrane protein YqaA with SNARE-associated domain